MAQSNEVLGEMPIGGRRITYGSWDNTSTETSAEIVTGLLVVEDFKVCPKGSGTLANSVVVNETFPLHSSTGEVSVTLAMDAGADGYWRAIGW